MDLRFLIVRVYIRVSYCLCRVQVLSGLERFCTYGLLRSFTVWQGLAFFTVLRLFTIRVYLRVSYGVQNLGFLVVQSGFAFRVAKGGLQLGRVQGFLVFGGFFWLGYCLGLVTVVQSLGFLRVKSSFTFRICQGGLRFGRVQGFFRVQRFFAARVLLRASNGSVGFRFAKGLEWFCAQGYLEVFCGLGIAQGQLRLCRVQGKG